MKVRVRVMGCGNSVGVPATGGFWGECDPDEPKNRRNRASLFLQHEQTNIVIDTSPDLREQLNQIAPVKHLDGVIYTHPHSDHIHGIDDLRVLWKQMKRHIDIYGNKATVDELQQRFSYIFHGSDDKFFPSFLTPHVVAGHRVIAGLPFKFFTQDHGTCETLGIRLGDFAYSTDMVNLDENALRALQGVKTWIVDAGGHWNESNPVHAGIPQILRWVERLKPEMTYLTVLSPSMDYSALCANLPPHVRPAYDGLELQITA